MSKPPRAMRNGDSICSRAKSVVQRRRSGFHAARSLWIASAAAFIAISGLTQSRADLPMGPPEDYVVRSSDGTHVAKITVEPPRTTIYSLRSGIESLAWAMDGFHRVLYLSDDGEHLVIAYQDLIASPDAVLTTQEFETELREKNARDTISVWSPAVFSMDMVMLRFINRGKAVREVPLRELMPDASKLQRRVSSWHWGMFVGFNSAGRFVAATVDYRTLFFDVKTGQIVRTEIRYPEMARDFLMRQSRATLIAASAIVGIVIGAALGIRTRAAIVSAIAASLVALFLHLWLYGTFGIWMQLGMGQDDFPAGGIPFVLESALLYLLPSTLTATLVTLLWRRLDPSLKPRPMPT